MSDKLRDCRHVEEEWIKKGEDVYRRQKWDGGEWSEWELTAMREVPYFILENLERRPD